MKRVLLFSVTIAVVGSCFFGCKKGPEDPLLSFRSRKERMTGVWKVTAYHINSADSLIDNVSPKDTTSNQFACSGTITYTKKKLYIMEFDKNGLYTFTNTFTWHVDRDWSVNTPECTDSLDYIWDDTTFLVKGLWTFGGGVGSYHNKELLELTDGIDQVTGTSFEIIELRDKHIQLRQSITMPLTGIVTRWEWVLEPYTDASTGNGNQ